MMVIMMMRMMLMVIMMMMTMMMVIMMVMMMMLMMGQGWSQEGSDIELAHALLAALNILSGVLITFAARETPRVRDPINILKFRAR